MILTSLSSLFPYKFVELSEGFRYLGFFLKPTNYRVEDWHWLIQKYEKRIGLLVPPLAFLGRTVYFGQVCVRKYVQSIG
jgi:hypothetical protein